MLEQNIKNYIGELTVQLFSLQHKIEELNKELEELKSKEIKNEK